MRLFVPLYLTPRCTGIYLHPVRGIDEISIEKTDTATALQLLDSMIDKNNSSAIHNSGINTSVVNSSAISASSIVTADRDRVLAMVYNQLYGPKIESTVSCKHCKEKFDVDFSLTTLLAQLHPETKPVPENGVYEMAGGIAYRLPTGEDEMIAMSAIGKDPVQALLHQCLMAGSEIVQPGVVEEQMAAIAPVLNLEMQAVCPECGKEQKVRFDMQSFLLLRLKKERPRLLYEIHRIAHSYYWSHQEILELPRSLRKQYVDLIEAG
jgi:hypothetical protein